MAIHDVSEPMGFFKDDSIIDEFIEHRILLDDTWHQREEDNYQQYNVMEDVNAEHFNVVKRRKRM